MTKMLGIVPYPEMKELMLTCASTRDDIDLEVFVGDYRDCIHILEENLNQDYEVILSRGATAAELARRIHYIPVIDIPVSAFDLITAVRLARSSGEKFAALCFPAIAADFQKLKELTGDDFKVLSVSSEEETIQGLVELKREGYGMVLCSAIAYEHALVLGIPSILITSGSDCISQALDEAMLLAGYYKKMHEELYFYKNILRTHERQTIILQEDGQILFTTAAYPLAEELCEHAKKEIALAKKFGKCSFYKVLGETRYAVDCEMTELRGRQCCALKFTRTKIPAKIDRHGITYTDMTAVRADLASVNLLTLLNDADFARLKAINRSSDPVFLTGEPNCYKSKIAKYLYLTGPLHTKPLILIDCMALDPNGWQFLMTNEHSPLTESGLTVLIKNLSCLDETKRTAFLNYVQVNLFCKRNRVYFVHTKTEDPESRHFISQLVQKTYCQVFEVPPLADRLDKLDACISVFLSRKNQITGEQVTGIEPKARKALQAYRWPYNYKQLERVMERLYDAAENGQITLQAATAVLQGESLLEDVPENGTVTGASRSRSSIDLSGTLDEITKSIVLQVLDECGGNQRAAAKRLQISRTTLWRMLKE